MVRTHAPCKVEGRFDSAGTKSHKVGGVAKKKDTNVITIDKYIY